MFIPTRFYLNAYFYNIYYRYISERNIFMVKESKNPETGLTHREELYAELCVVYPSNHKLAYEKAGFAKDNSDVNSSKKFKEPKFKEYYKTLARQDLENCKVTKERVLKEYERIAFFDIRNIIDDNGEVKSLDTLDEDESAVITGFEHKKYYQKGELTGESQTVKLADKLRALEFFAKHLKILDESGKNTPQVIIIKDDIPKPEQ